MTLKESLDSIGNRVKAAAARTGRNPADVTIVAITKQVDWQTIGKLNELNWRDIGENRVTDALDKARLLPGNRFTWHMVGHLQTNKVKKALALFDFIHSLASLNLAEAIQKEADKAGKKIKTLIEVNVSGEASKSGIRPEDLLDFYNKSKAMITGDSAGKMVISGLMTMAPIADNPESVRPYFRRLKELMDELRNNIKEEDASENLKYLSMGMSQDFEVAVEEGANMVRIGTAIFDPFRN